MKKTRTISALLALAALTLALCACGGGTAASSPYDGTWTAVEAGMGEDMQFDAGEIFPDGFSIDLAGDGTCTVTFGDESGPASWSVTEDGAITISDGSVDMSGTIDETTMKLDLQDGVNVTFLREGAEETEEAEEAAEEETEEAAETTEEAAEEAAEEEAPEDTTEEAAETADEAEEAAS